MRLNPCTISLLSISLVSACVPGLAQKKDDAVKLNQIQVIGTHNSYHAGIAASESKLWQAKHAEDYKGLEYQHQPLPAQLDGGVRQIELDIFADAKGGLYAHPAGPEMVAKAGLPADPPFDPEGVMAKPGFKVLHVQDVDYRSTCQPFTACLTQVRTWSRAHPGHIPIFILVETKEDEPDGISVTKPEHFTAATLDALDAEIRSVFSSDEMIVPDQVRGAFSTLNDAVVGGNWPTLANARGKVVFLMDQSSMSPLYLAGHPALRGRVLFTNAQPGDPDAAFVERNDGPKEEIVDLVRRGYLVRARTDANTTEARTNDVSKRDAMMASGAQMLSTDYPQSEPAKWAGGYAVGFAGKAVARGNPVNLAPADGKKLEKDPRN